MNATFNFICSCCYYSENQFIFFVVIRLIKVTYPLLFEWVFVVCVFQGIEPLLCCQYYRHIFVVFLYQPFNVFGINNDVPSLIPDIHNFSSLFCFFIRFPIVLLILLIFLKNQLLVSQWLFLMFSVFNFTVFCSSLYYFSLLALHLICSSDSSFSRCKLS